MTALAALALAGCGTETTDAAGSRGEPAGAVGARNAEAPTDAAQQAAFTAMLREIARSCPSGPPPARTLPTDDPRTEALEAPLAPTTEAELELDARDWCASAHHEQRIAQALWEVDDPTPDEVREILNNLGYIDDRIHRLAQSGTTTRFLLDLRVDGGRLCLDGSAAGEQTDVEKCVAPRTGPITASGAE
ncbi:hypothetical protein [Streptomyces sp. AS58]|uniref:hypothetical protein n=1 Tax=Streptomyces sp. AS58 TaxID=1519489 RepID=UPI000A546F01|nr:hypothetical protein [Streptomyces sp. AS58]